MDEENIKDLLSSLHCKFCGQRCLPGNIDLQERKGEYLVFSVYCHSCKHQAFVTAIIDNSKEEESSMELLPVFNQEEQERFCPPVTWDDILDMHIFLKDYDGDFSGLSFDEMQVGDTPFESQPGI